MREDQDTAISVQHVGKTFRLPREKHGSLKSVLINFRKRGYEEQHVLNDLSFEIKKGEFFGIVGRNGSGKSTLLKLLAGIYTPTKGRIVVNGKLTPFIELGVGFNPELTGRENIFLNGALLGFNRKEMDGMYDDIVHFAELSRFMDQKLKNYSSGMQVRLAFSIAIRARSDILLLDEVLAVGDAAFQQKCYDYFEELKQQHKTVVFVSHDMSAVRRFCNRALYIKNGRIVLEGSPAEVADFYAEENIEKAPSSVKKKEGATESSSYTVDAKVIDQNDRHVVLEVSYASEDVESLYIGISVQRDGISFAEITTPKDMPLTGKGKVTYTLDMSVLNGGTYQVGVGLFKTKSKRLLATSRTKCQFVLRHDDPTRGAALKLANSWRRN